MSEEGDNKCLDAKVVFLGESGVGKTSILRQFTSHQFDPECAASISSQYTTKTVDISGTKQAIRYDLWDTAGQEKYRSLAKIFYKDARIIIFVYDISSKKTYESLKDYWYKQVSQNCLPNTIFAIVGNKIDLYNNGEVKDNEAMEWADSIGAIFQTTSAMTNKGIDILFDNVGKKMLNPKYNYKSQLDKEKQLYEEKKGKKNKNDVLEEEDDPVKIPEIQKIKLNNNNANRPNKKCC